VNAELVPEAMVSQAAGQANGLLLLRGGCLLSLTPLYTGFVVSVGFEFQVLALVALVSGSDLAC